MYTNRAASVVGLFLLSFLLASPPAQARSYITCHRTTISHITLPRDISGAGSGTVHFSNGHFALLIGRLPDYWQPLQLHDHVLMCFNSDPANLCHHPIAVVDVDANFMFTSTEGPEGTC